MAVNLKGKSFLTLRDFSKDEIFYLLDLASDLKSKKRNGIRGNLLSGKNIALLFEKLSTRTRCSFTVAAIDEGGHAEFLGKNDIHLGEKEDIRDTARVLGRLFDGIEFRGYKQKTVEELAQFSGVPVWNGLTDIYHPTQVLADLMTIREYFGSLGNKKLVYVGDGRNNMANSLMIAAAKTGMDFTIAAPENLWPQEWLIEECKQYAENNNSEVTVCDDPFCAVNGANAVYTDVWVSMGEEEIKKKRIELLSDYQVNKQLLEATGRKDSIFLHCLPANKGQEVTEEIFESNVSMVFEEAENRMHTIKAVMVATIGNL